MRSSPLFAAIAVLFTLLAIGFSLTEKMRQSLTLNAPRVLVPVFMSKPELPAMWEALARVPRPRDVHSPPAARISVVLMDVGCVAAAVFGIYTLWKNPAAQGHSLQRLVRDNWFVLLWVASLISIATANVRRFLMDREVLRDGQLAPGVLTDWSKGRYGISIRYQFWTSSGQRFEGSGKLTSRWDLKATDGVFPVFYLSHQPKSNVALCCTDLRITGYDRAP